MLHRISDDWNERHWIGRGCLPAECLGAESLLRLVTAPGMHWPYLTLVKSSAQPAVRDFTTDIPGYRQRTIDVDRLSRLVADGYTLKYQRIEDFDDTVRATTIALQDHFGLATTSYAFVTPAESRGLSFHRDASHVVAVQLEGQKHWEIVRPVGGTNPNAGLEPAPQGEPASFVLSPGDVLYLPHGWPHRARTSSNRSTHLTFTITRPHPSALATELLVNGQTHPDTVLLNAVRRLGL
ncbi:cupin domain-containing protein [Streptomyces sp. TG1A-8]|uniref:JmjC domain-containing protein n=1 Tax=Streptomyces sp. TG1A-8 TaxID=3051385 RepID=UPI00265C5913|nr:cupin domain-containing protein [Streptomyces sp. TG1A-8]MDO0924061.1 cupin domain-containing protein [Streptomyces sp. TG1A-8]